MSSKLSTGPISGFPEWLPAQREVEREWLAAIERVYRSYGYASVETRSVEPIPVLLPQGGDTSKEIYGIHRLAADQQAHDEAGLALRFDLTVPFARYTAANLENLVLPFKRYQMQKVWRGERPQGGRFREFYQCDVDVVDRNTVAAYYDAEVASAALEAVAALQLGPINFKINNRKVLEGFYLGLGVDVPFEAMRIMDKIDKVGAQGVSALLRQELELSDSKIEKCVTLSGIKLSDADTMAQAVRKLGVQHGMLTEGLDELTQLGRNLGAFRAHNARVTYDLSIARGLAYYTGNVFESELERGTIKASICSGGRYENLVGDMAKVALPGVGISIGLTRVMSIMIEAGLLPERRQSPSEVMVALTPGLEQPQQIAIARTIRAEGHNVEVYPSARKLGDQFRYAARKGIPFVMIPGTGGAPDQIKDMQTGEQKEFTLGLLRARKLVL
jgi:histidyl-tRNA synthetase